MAYDNRCEGYTGADLAALIREAGMEALKEIIAGYGQSEISMRHIVQAFDKVQSSVREKASINLTYLYKSILDNTNNKSNINSAGYETLRKIKQVVFS